MPRLVNLIKTSPLEICSFRTNTYVQVHIYVCTCTCTSIEHIYVCMYHNNTLWCVHYTSHEVRYLMPLDDDKALPNVSVETREQYETRVQYMYFFRLPQILRLSLNSLQLSPTVTLAARQRMQNEFQSKTNSHPIIIP